MGKMVQYGYCCPVDPTIWEGCTCTCKNNTCLLTQINYPFSTSRKCIKRNEISAYRPNPCTDLKSIKFLIELIKNCL